MKSGPYSKLPIKIFISIKIFTKNVLNYPLFYRSLKKIKTIGSIGADSLVDIKLCCALGVPSLCPSSQTFSDFIPLSMKSNMMKLESFLTLHKQQCNYYIQGPER